MLKTNNDINNELLKSTRQGDLKNMRYLLEQGADINTRDSVKGDTLLHLAVVHHHKEIVLFLIQKGMDVNIKNNLYQVPLSCISDEGFFVNQEQEPLKKEIIDCLLLAGINHFSLESSLRALAIRERYELAHYLIQSSLWQNPTLDREEICPNDKKLLTFWSCCKDELDRLQKETIGDIAQQSHSLWDFLQTDRFPEQGVHYEALRQGIFDILVDKNNFSKGGLVEEQLKQQIQQNKTFCHIQGIILSIGKAREACNETYPIYKGKIKAILAETDFRKKLLHHVLNLTETIPSLEALCLNRILDRLLQEELPSSTLAVQAVQEQRSTPRFQSAFFSSPSVREVTSERLSVKGCSIS